MFIIYMHTNKVNGKKYIGQTSLSLEERCGKDGKNYDPSYKFGRAISKYGWDCFDHEIITEAATLDEANELEKYYISFYDSYRNGYNMTLGGRGVINDTCSIGVFQVDTEKKIVNHFDSIASAANCLDVCASNISSCLLGTQLTCHGFYFFPDNIDIDTIQLPKSKYNRSIICTNTGVIYETMFAASKELGISYASIARNCARNSVSAGGYVFAFFDEYDEFWTPVLRVERTFDWLKRKIICVETGDLWDSITDCSIETGIKTQNLSHNCCIHHRTAKGFHYAFLDDYSEDWVPAPPYNSSRRAHVSSLKRPVYCLQTNQFYNSATECANLLHLDRRLVSRCAIGELISTGGYNFCYSDLWTPEWKPRDSKQGQKPS